MRYTAIPNTNITIPRLCLGCMSFGGGAGQTQPWTLDPDRSQAIISHALDRGINFFDTSNNYSAGASEEYLGRALKNLVPRDRVIIASKVYFNPDRLAPDAIRREIEGTLRRLQTDHLDLYIIHRYDYATPIEQTLAALHALVTSGKVRALGASAMYAYQFHTMQNTAAALGLTPFVTMQNHYNLLYREDEREMIPLCRQLGVALTPYSPLAAGRLARPQRDADTLRNRTDQVARARYDTDEYTRETDGRIIDRVAALARDRGTTMTAIALAWHYAKGIAAPVIGATKPAHIDDACAALDITLTQQEIDTLETPYIPHKITGARLKNADK